MNFYEISLENGKEYIRTGINKVEKLKAGMWIIAFMDVDWELLSEKCSSILSDYNNPRPISAIFGNFFDYLYDELRPLHPLMRDFIDVQFYQHMRNRIRSDGPSIETAEAKYLDALLQQENRGIVADEFPLDCLKWLNERFHTFAKLKDYLKPLLDEIMCSEELEADSSILARYYRMRITHRSYGLTLYRALEQIIQEPFVDAEDHICDLMPSVKETDDEEGNEKNFTYHIYQASDSLEALTLWEFDQLCGRNIQLRKCKNCGRYFAPHSVVSCYCDRQVPGTNGKTCKKIGASIIYQKKINADTAQKLYKKANNRIHTYASRKKDTNPEMLQTYYLRWQYDAQTMLEKTKSGELDFEIFKEEMERSGPNVMKLYKAKNKNNI